MSNRIYVLIGLMLLSIGMMEAQQTFTLQQCVDTALFHNRNIKQQELTKQSRELAYQQARTDILPNLNASMGQAFTFGRSLVADNTYQSVNSSQSSFNISSGITLFDGLKMKHNIDSRKAEMQSSEADLEKIKKDIELNVNIAFLQVLLYKENLKTQQSQIDASLQNIEQKTALVEAGKLPEGELYELKAQLAKEELNITHAKNNLNLALLDLAQIIELDEFTGFDIVDDVDVLEDIHILISAEEVYQSALQTRPEIRAAEYRLQAQEKNVSIARSAYFPTLSFGAQLGTGYYNLQGVANNPFQRQLNDNLSTHLGFNLQIPIFNRFDVKNRVKSSQMAVENSQLEIENTKYELRKRVEQAYQNALAAQARYAAAQKTELASKEAYRYAESKYEAGRASVYELYQAKTNHVQVLSELSQSKYEYALRVKVLEMMKE